MLFLCFNESFPKVTWSQSVQRKKTSHFLLCDAGPIDWVLSISGKISHLWSYDFFFNGKPYYNQYGGGSVMLIANISLLYIRHCYEICTLYYFSWSSEFAASNQVVSKYYMLTCSVGDKYVSGFCFVCARASEKGEWALTWSSIWWQQQDTRVRRSHSLHSHFSSENLWFPCNGVLCVFFDQEANSFTEPLAEPESGCSTSWIALWAPQTWSGAASLCSWSLGLIWSPWKLL